MESRRPAQPPGHPRIGQFRGRAVDQPARAKGSVPWRYYTMTHGGLFAMAGLYTEAANRETGEVMTTYTVITTDANEAIQIHDRMPVIVAPRDATAWLWREHFPAELMRPYPTGAML